MKVDKLIRELQKLRKEYGNVDVVYSQGEMSLSGNIYTYYFDITEKPDFIAQCPIGYTEGDDDAAEICKDVIVVA